MDDWVSTTAGREGSITTVVLESKGAGDETTKLTFALRSGGDVVKNCILVVVV